MYDSARRIADLIEAAYRIGERAAEDADRDRRLADAPVADLAHVGLIDLLQPRRARAPRRAEPRSGSLLKKSPRIVPVFSVSPCTNHPRRNPP